MAKKDKKGSDYTGKDIQVLTGLTVGNRALVVVDQDEHRLVLTERTSGRQVEATLTDAALAKGKRRPLKKLYAKREASATRLARAYEKVKLGGPAGRRLVSPPAAACAILPLDTNFFIRFK